jgi:6-phosphogluconolactonase
LTLDEGARIFAEHFTEVAPHIVFAFMGMGPDGHIASLFPGKPEPAAGVDVIAEHTSPKPPPQRLSLTYEAINRIDEIWFTVAGADKAEVVEVALSENSDALPVGRVHGAKRNVWFIDEAASANI